MFERVKKKDLPFEIDDIQIRELMKLANFTQRDVFYDLGSGRGRVIMLVVKESKAKKAIGIEALRDLYQRARNAANEDLTDDQFKKVDFWHGDFDAQGLDGKPFLYEMCDATVIYYGVDESEDTIGNLKDRFRNKRQLKIIIKNLPFVGYASVPNRANDACWFYLTKNPPKRIRSKREWAGSVFEKQEATISEVYEYYADQLKKQYPDERDRKYRKGTLLDLKKLVHDRF